MWEAKPPEVSTGILIPRLWRTPPPTPTTAPDSRAAALLRHAMDCSA
eukprot:CAMPEP_0174299376 /NCGR_PEP_ID=MMETSP0809-20121228/56505_1 /TAXON_ID=73025 ORGANISM="Eutreptiella gymnastica-like, Strain CCMP1594" /NCGR_SAMPLE_ID=MMETSP0809 /ASSEMBLY_ACC=CAM_ASM_000658 /LENGTH=46 /DNA_ID= /DNA_START= /DNA_END= /DNA_ORIENTATION=